MRFTVRTDAALLTLALAGVALGCQNFAPPAQTPAPPPPPLPALTGPTLIAQPIPTAPSGENVPAGLTGPADNLVTLRKLLQRAQSQHAQMDSYLARLRRRERIKGQVKPEELLMVRVRQEPLSVHFKWIGTEGKGRELLYVQGRNGNKINVLTAAGDIPFAPAGKRMALDPDGLLVRSSSRHHISEAGFGTTLARMNNLLGALEKGRADVGAARYLGRVSRPEFGEPVEGIEQTIPPGQDDQLPQGGRREIYLDPRFGLPVLVATFDHPGQEVEYYFFDRFQFPVALDDADFDPDRLWGKGK